MLDLINSQLLEDLTNLHISDIEYDLHNDFDCRSIVYDSSQPFIKFFFERINSSVNQSDKVCITFNDIRFAKINLFMNRTADSATINTFYRGRFEKDGQAVEYGEGGAGYFYIEFEQGDVFELFSKSVLFEVVTMLG